MSTRDWVEPPEANTLHLIGDLQNALTYDGPGTPPSEWTSSMRKGRRDKIVVDWQTGNMPSPAGGHLTVGDLIHRGTAAEDADVKAMFTALTAGTGRPVYPTLGNHDIYENKRTPAQWAAAWGLSSPNYVVDLPWVRLLIIGIEPLRVYKTPGVIDQGKCWLSETTLRWLDWQLSMTTKNCWIVCHAPLRYTVQGTDDTGWIRSDNDPLFAELLASNPNARAWISGHTHTSLQSRTTGAGGTNQAGVWITTTLGGRKFANINAGCLANSQRVEEIDSTETVNWATEWWEPLQTFWLTAVDDNRYELRARDHGAQAFLPRTQGNPARVDVIDLT